MRPSLAKNSLWNRAALHGLFWLAVFVCFTYIDGGYDGRYDRAAAQVAIHLPVKIAFTYAVLYGLIPRYLYQRKLATFCLLLLLSLFAAAVAHRLLQGYVTLPLYRRHLPFTPFDASRLLWAAFEIAFPAAAAVSIKLYQSHHEKAHIAQQLENEMLQTELKFLKAQMSPHFLFNTLNNIYGLSLSQSSKVPGAILRLSELLRFVLKNSSNGHITLQEELEILDNYIALEQLRYGERLHFLFTKDIDDTNCAISPLILLSLVENSFKHGVSESLSKPYVNIALSVKEGALDMAIMNSKERGASNGHNGIGLTNVKRQLDLTYGQHYHLDIRDDADVYCLNLSINLKQK